MSMYKKAYRALLNGILEAEEEIEKNEGGEEKEILEKVLEKLKEAIVKADNIIVEGEEEI